MPETNQTTEVKQPQPNSHLADAKALAYKWRATRVVILAMNDAGGTFEVTSYGMTRAMCDSARKINDQLFRLISEGTLEVN